jgi:hypothetical protein
MNIGDILILDFREGRYSPSGIDFCFLDSRERAFPVRL